MKSRTQWTNHSVLGLAGDRNPVDVIEERVRAAVLRAMDDGWNGPPYDPVELARHLGLEVEPRDDVADARTVATNDHLKIEFNPLRPRGRLRFSIAHEIAHTLFPDCAQAVRHRGGNVARTSDDWQLEALCNIGAAELLMPAGSLGELTESELAVANLLELRKKFDVSTEALLIRVAKLATAPCAAFCASRHNDAFHLDYLIASPGWRNNVYAGQRLPENSLVANADAIGFTSIGDEAWNLGEVMHVECVGLAPYPGGRFPRVAGLVRPANPSETPVRRLTEVSGDALRPHGAGRRIVAQVVPDTSLVWGGGGFAAQVRKRFPKTWAAFRADAFTQGIPLALGTVIRGELDENITILHMVAQHGIGFSNQPRIRYSSLERCLRELGDLAAAESASVHMPRIGTGQAGGRWEVIRELILDAVVARGIEVFVYTLPGFDARTGALGK